MNKNKFRYFLLVILILILCYGAGRLYFFFTDGFTVNAISSSLSNQRKWEIPDLSIDDQKNINQILRQNFTYLGKGGQSYVLLSADKKYVIKFFKHKLLKYPFWINFPVPDYFKLIQEEKKRQKEKKRDDLFYSCLIAFEDLKEETGVVFVHFNQTDFLPKETIIIDKIGVSHSIDLNQIEFIIQKTACPIQDTIKALVEKGDLEEAKKRLDQLIALLVTRSKKGVKDKDPAFEQNIGFIDHAAISIDLGQFVKSEEIKNFEAYKKDIIQRTAPFQQWLNINYPELGIYFAQTIEAIQ